MLHNRHASVEAGRRGGMLYIEKSPGDCPTYCVIWGGRKASRSFPRTQQAYVVMWAILSALFAKSSIPLSFEKIQSDLYFAKTMVRILKESVKTDNLLAIFVENLQDELFYWESEEARLRARSVSSEEKEVLPKS